MKLYKNVLVRVMLKCADRAIRLALRQNFMTLNDHKKALHNFEIYAIKFLSRPYPTVPCISFPSAFAFNLTLTEHQTSRRGKFGRRW